MNLQDFYRGDTVKLPLGVQINGVDEPLSGSTFTLYLRSAVPGSPLAKTKSISVAADDPATLTTLRLESLETLAFATGAYLYTLKWVNSSSDTTTLSSGRLNVLEDYARVSP